MADCMQCQQALARIAELEAELKTTGARFEQAERAARVGYWRLTVPDFKKNWSPGMYTLLGQEPGSPPPPAEMFFSQKDAEGYRRYIRKRDDAIRSRSSFSDRSYIRCADGSERVFDSDGEVEIGPNGDVVAIIGTARDVTDQVTIEAERNRAQEIQNIMTEASSDIIMVHDAQGAPRFVSAALGRTLGWSLQDTDWKNFLNFIHPEDIAEVRRLRKMPPPGTTITGTYRARHADGRYVWLESTVTSVHDEATGEFLYCVGVARDVSERKSQELAIQKAREDAETANRAKSAFLANMSHELRTPLNAIIGFADAMDQALFGEIGNARYRDYVSVIHNSGQHLLALINDILDVAKIEAGKFELTIEEMDLVETIETCVRTMTEPAQRAGVVLDASLLGESLICKADRRAMKQIVLNLLSNAIKYSPIGGRVEISAAICDDRVRIEIRDDGIGIPAEDLPRLAQPFEQVRDDPHRAKTGTGLGLALVRGLAEQHGGTLTIDSPARKGTIVTVEFPQLAPGDAAAA